MSHFPSPHRLLRPLSTLLAIPVLLGGLVVASPAEGKAEEPAPSPRPWLEQKVEKARALATRKVKKGTPAAEKLEKDVRALIDEMLDWDEMTSRSLGSEWKKRTPAEREEFSKILREMIEASYESKMRLASRGEVKRPTEIKINWLEEKVKRDKAKLSAMVESGKTKAMLEFSLVYDGKTWQVYDLAIDDVSTVRTYRSQFRKLINDKGFDGLLERMRSKIKDIREGRGDLASAIR